MNRTKILYLAIVGVFSALLSGCSLFSSPNQPGPPVPEFVNLVPNPSFEVRREGSNMPEHWIGSQFDATVTFARTSEKARSGEYSVRIVGQMHESKPNGPRGSVHQHVPLDEERGQTYRLSAWYQTQDVTKADAVEIRLTFYDEANQTVNIRENDSFEVISPDEPLYKHEGGHLLHLYADSLAEGEWKQIESIFKAPDEAVEVDIQLFLWYHPGTVWWDDVVLELVD